MICSPPRIAVCNTWSSEGSALCRMGGVTSQLDLSLMPLLIAGCGWLQLGAPHWATSVKLLQVIIIIIIIIIKKGWQCKAEREWCTPYQSKDLKQLIIRQLIKYLKIEPALCGSRFSTGRHFAIEVFLTFNKLSLSGDCCIGSIYWKIKFSDLYHFLLLQLNKWNHHHR